MEHLEEENKDLRFEIEQQHSIIESQKQELHSAHMKIECLSRMKVEMEIEIEALNGLQHINGDLVARVKNLEVELNAYKIKSEALEEDFRNEKVVKDKLIADLNIELETLRNKPADEQKFVEEKNLLLTKLGLMEETHATISEQNLTLQNENKNLADRAVVLEISLHEKTQELEEVKNVLDVKSNDLKSTLKLMEELQEEKTVLNNELIMMKSKPAPNGLRGNSLFAEVDDNRKKVTQALESYKKKYAEMKKNFFKKNTELKALEAELIEVKKKFDDNEKAPFDYLAGLNEAYKTRIQDLTYRVSILEKRPESPQLVPLSDITSANYDSIKNMIDMERKQNREMAEEMERRSTRELALEEKLFQLNNEIRLLKTKRIHDSAKIDELKIKLEKKDQSC